MARMAGNRPPRQISLGGYLMKRFSRSARGAAAILLLISATAPSASAADPRPSLDDRIAKAVTFRETFGFAADLPLVKRAESDTAYDNRDYGVPLSASEVAEMQRRLSVEDAARPAAAIALEQVDTAGYYFDQARLGIPVFLFAGPTDKYEADLANAMPGIDFEVRAVKHLLSELEALRDTITNDADALSTDGIVITSVGLHVSSNRVQVGLEDMTADAVAFLQGKYGGAIEFRALKMPAADACTSTNSCRPVRGGLKIIGAVNGNGCTLGYIVRRSSNGGGLATLTAGHCIANEPINSSWNHDGSRFGDSKFNTWVNHSEGDVGIIELDADEVPATANRLYIYNGSSGATYNVVASVSDANQTEGSQACAYGAYSNNSACGVIRAGGVNVQHTSPAWGLTRWIDNTNEYSLDMMSGDGGGPVYQVVNSTDRRMLGTHVHSTDGVGAFSWYTTYRHGQSAYSDQTTDSYILCTSAGC